MTSGHGAIGVAALIFSAYLTSGCTGITTVPTAARGGETVMLAVGTPEGMTKSNIAVTFTSDVDGSVTDLTPSVRSLIKLYPSKTSSAALNKTALVYTAGHEPWLSTLAIDLPPSAADGGPLPVGTGKVRVQCVPRASCKFPSFYPHTNDIDMSLEILPGNGEPNPFKYQAAFGFQINADTALLEEQPQLVVRPDTNGTSTFSLYGAAEFKINLPVTTYNGGVVPDSDIVIVAEDLTTLSASQRNLMWKREGNDFTVVFSSPKGMKYSEFRFSIVLKLPGASSQPPHVYAGSPSLVSERYYSINGDSLDSGSSPSVNVAMDYL